MEATEILDHLADEEAVLTRMHFVYTDGDHGPAYINMRQVGHQTTFLQEVGDGLADELAPLQPNIVIGPETLGRTLATYVGNSLCIDAIWCDIVGEGKDRKAQFSPKLNFARLVNGKKVVIVDDLLTTGSSIKLVVELIEACGGQVVAVAVVVRRSPDVVAETCNVPELKVLAEVQGFEKLSKQECEEHGPCAILQPIVRRPGHGWQYEAEHPDYPGGFTDLQT